MPAPSRTRNSGLVILHQGGITHILAQLETQFVDTSLLFHAADLGILFNFVLDLYALPGQLAP